MREGERNPASPFTHGYAREGQAIRRKVDARSSSVPGPFLNGHS